MQQFALLSALFAAGVISKPLHENHAQFHKRQEVVNVATDYAYETAVVTVTYGQEQPSATAAPATSAAPTGNSIPNNHPKFQNGNKQVPHGGGFWWNQQAQQQQQSNASPPSVLTTVIPPASSAAPSTTPSSTFAASSSAAAPSSEAASPASSAASAVGVPGPIASAGNAFLDAHNAYRAIHGATLMSWNESLADTAKNYGCANGDKQAGSNWAGGSTMSEADAVKMWYDEEQAYATATNNYSQDPPSGYSGPETGHFSQLIWEASTSVGCAMVNNCGSYSNQVTCLYSPAGNVAMAGQESYVQNVFAPKVGGQ